MCGIVGYIGHRQAQTVLINCLSRLEYRGYDSCGIAVCNGNLSVYKDAVRVKVLEEESPILDGTAGIGHTRWATHGEPSIINSHPHLDCTARISVVHNGVISNYQKIKQQLTSEGHNLVSETDTEVIPHLIEKYYSGNLKEAVEFALGDIEGSYAIAVATNEDHQVVVAKKDSPLVIGVGDGEYFIASDVPAILDYTNKVIYLEDGDIAAITRDGIQITKDGIEYDRETHVVLWGREDIQKAGYEHYMLKEIHEQPKIIRDTIGDYLGNELSVDTIASLYGNTASLAILACGTSYHAGMIGKYVIEELLGIPVRLELASEFNHCGQILGIGQAIVISQSGETADVLMAMKRLHRAGIEAMVISNVPGSTAGRTADQSFYTAAGPELSVAATKSFTAQLIALYYLALSSQALNRKIYEHLIEEFRQLPAKVQQVLDAEQHIADFAKYLIKYNNSFVIGRGINYPTALEGALKLKEISYIHAEGFAAGELKHGPFALLSADTPVIAIIMPDNTYDNMITNIKEVKARKAPVIALADEADGVIADLADFVIRIPSTVSLFSPIVNVVALQLLAYYTARYRGCSVDFPRNLAKSVTVE